MFPLVAFLIRLAVVDLVDLGLRLRGDGRGLYERTHGSALEADDNMIRCQIAQCQTDAMRSMERLRGRRFVMEVTR